MESLVHYTNPAHAVALLEVLNEQRLNGQHCDVVLIVGDQKFQAHKSVLAASSDYFTSLFASTEAEPCTMVQLDFCEPSALENVLNYLYTSSLFVDKQSVAAIQELGYGLGIPYLTGITLRKPRFSYGVSRKRTAFSEGADFGCLKRNVVMCQNAPEEPGTGSPHVKRPTPQEGATDEHTPATKGGDSAQPADQEPCQSPEYTKANRTSRNTISPLRKSAEGLVERDPGGRSSPTVSPAEGTLARTFAERAPRTSSISLGEYRTRRSETLTDASGAGAERLVTVSGVERESPCEGAEPMRTIDRSGPLIKSLLRRSLSVDGSVPFLSLALGLNAERSPEEPPGRRTMKERPADREPTEHKLHGSKPIPPLSIKSELNSNYNEADAHDPAVRVKTEPSSPLADSSDIIQVTIGENFPLNFKDRPTICGRSTQRPFSYYGKRKARLDSGKAPRKKSRVVNKHRFSAGEDKTGTTVHNSDAGGDSTSVESGQSGTFECCYCLQVLRSKAGLCRHTNMFHNPRKAYSCNVCHKRFHTSFKVWTHRQTQHGVLPDPSASTGPCAVPGEKAHGKPVETAQAKLRKESVTGEFTGAERSGPLSNRTLRTRSKVHTCPFCQKEFWLESLFRQHLDTHICESSDVMAEGAVGPPSGQRRDERQDVYPCSFCDEKLASVFEQGEHEREFHYTTVCSYCALSFSSFRMVEEHESHCKHKKLSCLECMRTFKSSFSLWRHQVEVHKENSMTIVDQSPLPSQADDSEAANLAMGVSSREEMRFSDSSELGAFESEESSFIVEDLNVARSQEGVSVKEEPREKPTDDGESPSTETDQDPDPGGPSAWACENCGEIFLAQKYLENHQEVLCHIKPFNCHFCKKAFRTNFRLWSHIQRHMSATKGLGAREKIARPLSLSPSPPPAELVSRLPVRKVSPPSLRLPATETVTSSLAKLKKLEQETPADSKVDVSDKNLTPQESNGLFPHGSDLDSPSNFRKQHFCKLCYRTFKSPFSLWSHEQSHANQ